MLTMETLEIIAGSKGIGWVLEPEAKKILSLGGLPVPRFRWAKSDAEAVAAAREIGYPVVAKVVCHGSSISRIQVEVALNIAGDRDSMPLSKVQWDGGLRRRDRRGDVSPASSSSSGQPSITSSARSSSSV